MKLAAYSSFFSGLVAWTMLFAPAGSRAAPSGADLAERCQALQSSDFASVPDAPTQVLSAVAVPASDGLPAMCSVRGYVAAHVGFELRLPLAGWNGKFLKVGCGGFCGSALPVMCTNGLRRGYACIASDMGHVSTGLDAKWAYNNLQAEVDFAYRATHVVTLAGKAITQRFYESPPDRTYFMGCSTGGRQAMVSAQRFPHDFDGIVAGAPPFDETAAGASLLWNALAARRADGSSVLDYGDLEALNRAAVSRCDAQDGLRDGIIEDPRACRFDPAELQCEGTARTECLTAEQVTAARKIYGGAVDSKGNRLFRGRSMPGSELNWAGYLGPSDSSAQVRLAPGGMRADSNYFSFMREMFRYMNFMPDPGPSWDVTTFDWDRDPRRLGLMEALYSATNPDLRRFKAAGGKMILYQGWNDQSVLPESSIDYYETVERTMGGRAATQDFFRLFMVPGMDHCAGGVGASAIDFLSYLEKWVENGEAPESLIAARPVGGARQLTYPVDPGKVEFTRPVFPYPHRTRYSGRGDPNDARSFKRE